MIVLGIALALLTAVVQSVSYVVSGSYVKRTGLPGWTFVAPQQLLMTIPYALVAWAFRPINATFTDWKPILLGGLVCMVAACFGNTGLFQMQKTVEPSRTAPLQAVKIPLIALFSFLTLGRTYSLAQIAGLALVLAAAALLCGAGRRIRFSAWAWLFCCCAGYAACDTSIANMLDESRILCGGTLRTSFFVMGVANAAAGLLSVPMLAVQKLSGSPIPAARDWLRYALPYGLLWMIAMCFLFVAFSLCGVVLGAIVQSSRGLISVALGWFLARHGFGDVEEPISASVFRRRLAAAALIIAAISLYARFL